jgi:hypothetical protein
LRLKRLTAELLDNLDGPKSLVARLGPDAQRAAVQATHGLATESDVRQSLSLGLEVSFRPPAELRRAIEEASALPPAYVKDLGTTSSTRGTPARL